MKLYSSRIIYCLFALSLLFSCEPEIQAPPMGKQYKDNKEERSTVQFMFNDSSYGGIKTKTSLGSGVETIFSGAVLAAYNSSTGNLDSYIELSSSQLCSTIEMELPTGVVYDFFLLGNMWLIDKESGNTAPPIIPARVEEMRDFEYRLDGKDVGKGLRNETFGEVSDYGLPLCWSESGVDPFNGNVIDIEMTRLFSKLNLTIDHSGLAGTSLEDFVNGSIKIRSSNCKLRPFDSNGSTATASEDILDIGDYDSVMENSLSKTFVFYVPENMNGDLLSENSDPDKKTMETVAEAVGEEASKYLTYIEFSGTLSGVGTGIEGDIVYRFFMGKDAVRNFDVPRNSTMNVTLSFNAESVFSASWKIDSGDMVDDRAFFLSGELAGRLPENKVIAVRKNRAGTFNLNICLGEDGENIVGEAKLVNPGYKAEALNDFAWTSNILSSSGEDSVEEARVQLASVGVSVVYADGTFEFAVTEQSLFRTGVEVPVVFTLYPGGKQTTAVIKTFEDISYREASKRSLSSSFTVAQSRNLSFSGLMGDNLYYCSDQTQVTGHSYENEHSNNRQWKTTNDLSAPFVMCAVDDDGEIILPYKDYSLYETQKISTSESLNVYAFYPNDFKSTTGPYKDTASEGSIIVCTDDVHNDGLIEIPLRITMPVLDDDFYVEKTATPLLFVDGSEIPMIVFHDCDTDNSIPYKKFDPVLYDALIKPNSSYSDDTPWMDCVEFDDERGSIYIARTTYTDTDGTVKNIEDLELYSENEYYMDLGYLSINENLTVNVNFPHSRGIWAYFLQPKIQGSGTNSYNNMSYFSKASETDSIYYGISDLYFATCDTVYNKASHTGEVYTLKDDKVSPVVHFETKRGNLKYIFRQAEQPSYIEYMSYDGADKGESDSTLVHRYFPGWLQVPYGEHSFNIAATNRWDGRTINYTHTFTFNYELQLMQFIMYRKSYDPKQGWLYFVPEKNAYYLSQNGGEPTVSSMLEVLGTNEWMNHVYILKAFKNPNTMAYQYNYGSTWTKFTYYKDYYDVTKYDSSAKAWTETLAKSEFGNSSVEWIPRFGLDDVLGSDLVNDPAVTGSEYLRVKLRGDRIGYCFQ